MDYLNELVYQIELHDVEGIRDSFGHGVNPNDLFKGEPLIYELTSEYTRTPRFKDCVKLFVDFGLEMKNQALLRVLLDDAPALETLLKQRPEEVHQSISLRCAYTPLYNASLLHVCAEFNHVACAQVLLNYGAEVNVPAGKDEFGFGGQTPIFHTVNQNLDNSKEMMQFLLENNADLHVTVPGITWGKGYEWETLVPAVNPVSYAMMGMLPQMHRDERLVSNTVLCLLKKAYNITYGAVNVPCAYLSK